MKKDKQINIPKGNSSDDVYLRKAIINANLFKLIGTGVVCGALGGKLVEFIPVSIDETATHASRNYESTLAALRVVEAIKKAKLRNKTEASSGKQKKLNFKVVYELSANLSGIGQVKIIVGERKLGRVLHYCITKKRS